MEQTPEELIDEIESLEKAKKHSEERIEKLKIRLIGFAQQRGVNYFIGTNKKCLIKEYDKIVYPEDKKAFVELIKSKRIYEECLSLNYLKLGIKIRRNQVDNDILTLIKKEKAYIFSMINKNPLAQNG